MQIQNGLDGSEIAFIPGQQWLLWTAADRCPAGRRFTPGVPVAEQCRCWIQSLATRCAAVWRALAISADLRISAWPLVSLFAILFATLFFTLQRPEAL